MPENEFEGEIRRKMEHLELRPSDTVWERVEREIRVRKKRRALMLMPLVLLFIGGAAWWGIKSFTTNERAVARNTHSGISVQPQNADQPIVANDSTSTYTVQSSDESVNQPNPAAENTVVPTGKPAIAAIGNPRIQNNKAENANDKIAINRNKRTSVLGQPPVTSGRNNPGIKAKNQDKLVQNDKPDPLKGQLADKGQNSAETDKHTQNDSSAKGFIAAAPAVKTPDNNQPSVTGHKADSLFTSAKQPANSTALASIPGTVKKKKTTSFSWGVNSSGGSTLPGKMVEEITPELMYATNAAPGNMIRPSQPISSTNDPARYAYIPPKNPSSEAHFSLSVGAFVQKKLSDRWAISSGLYYKHLANQYETGEEVNKENRVFLNDGRSVPVTKYYKSGKGHTYVNRFGFIEVPLELNFTINPASRVKIGIDAGGSYQHMVTMDALHYSTIDWIFFENNELINRSQWAVQTGVNLQFNAWNNLPVKIGPVFSRHITSNKDKSAYAPERLSFLGVRLGVTLR